LFIGPVFTREVAIAPRRARLYVARSVYLLVLLLLICTAWLVLTGTQMIQRVGEMAQFGAVLFQLLAPLQLTLALFFSALFAASAVAAEKDRRTMLLLLLTNLTNCEVVLGKLLASLLTVLMLWLATIPLLMMLTLFGGVSYAQIARVAAVTLASVLVCGSLGSTLALWREKTFQALAMTLLVLVLWLGAWEAVARGLFGSSVGRLDASAWGAAFSPWQAVLDAMRPHMQAAAGLEALRPVGGFLITAAAFVVSLNALAVIQVRRWNTTREGRRAAAPDEDQPLLATRSSGPAKATRHVWDNPVLWREMRTWAYGRKILMVRLVYLVLFGLAAVYLHQLVQAGQTLARSDISLALAPLFLLSLVLINAQAVTSMTSERDTRALDLLLVTDLTPREVVFGKLGGVLYNTKEMVLLPVVLLGYFWMVGGIRLENMLYVVGCLTVLDLFVAVLGIHAGMVYFNSRSAVGTSLGTVFFLFVGVAVCMRMMMAFSGSFQAQLQPFLAFMIGGGVGLYLALGARNPSTAIGVASFVCPLATFYAITSYLLDFTLAVFLVTAVTYGFTTAAMLVPAIYEFDVATGRTTIEEP